MMTLAYTIIVVLIAITSVYAGNEEGCTAIVVGPKASTDGSLFTTHNNDCTNCDVRIALVPSASHRPGSWRPVYPSKQDYPRYIGNDRGDTYSPEELDLSVLTNNDNGNVSDSVWNFFLNPEPHVPLGYIKQAEYTASYIDGNYGIANEYGLMMGESTCAANLVSWPRPVGYALFDVAALTRLAMERCATARCAIKTMGQAAETHGYYGMADPLGAGEALYWESGEAITIIDRSEAWIFHILPDDTGRSAVWAAQRVPDDHIAVVANMFVIEEMDLENSDYYLASPNMKEVGKRTGLWKPDDQARGIFNFKEVYSPSGGAFAHPNMWYRRTWQIYNLAAPSLKLEADRQQPYPFSIKPDTLISLEDMFKFNRDTFEGTPYDLNKGPAAGPYGNPNRYDRSRESAAYSGAGYFERGISLHRTAYSTVVQSRPWLPPVISGVVWFGQHAPHASTFAPLYGSATELPPSYTRGTIYKFDRESSWWAACAVENYAEKMYNVIAVEIKAEQKLLEGTGQKAIQKMDQQALTLYKSKGGNPGAPIVDAALAPTNAEVAVKDALTSWTVKWGEHVTSSWWGLFERCLTKYRDGFILQHHYPPSTLKPVFYPAWWLGTVGYYEKGPAPFYAYSHPNAVPVAPNPSGSWPPRITPPALNGNEWSPEPGAPIPSESPLPKKGKGTRRHASVNEVPSITTPAIPESPVNTAASVSEPCQPSSNPMSGITILSLIVASLAGGYIAGRYHSRKNAVAYSAVPDLE